MLHPPLPLVLLAGIATQELWPRRLRRRGPAAAIVLGLAAPGIGWLGVLVGPARPLPRGGRAESSSSRCSRPTTSR